MRFAECSFFAFSLLYRPPSSLTSLTLFFWLVPPPSSAVVVFFIFWVVFLRKLCSLLKEAPHLLPLLYCSCFFFNLFSKSTGVYTPTHHLEMSLCRSVLFISRRANRLCTLRRVAPLRSQRRQRRGSVYWSSLYYYFFCDRV
uniref:Uncharacterized protein n=1 Tax=Ixodes ricinus TaxID=34613 RepID=A0A6B0UTG7_IXORI